MTGARNELQAAARKRHQALRRKQRDPRFKKVVGRFVAADLLTTNIDGIRPHDKPVPLDDALWAGTVEPRIMELLPAVFVKKPGLLRLPKDLPEDVVTLLGRAYGTFVIRNGKKRVTLGRDCRLTSPGLHDALLAGMESTGLEIIDVGVCPTPLLYFSLFH